MVQTFKDMGINNSLIGALEKEKITAPTEVQGKVIPLILDKKDLIVRWATGTGKTLAYLLPLFQKIDWTKKELAAIILVPTHELAIQVGRQIERLSQNSDIKINSAVIIGNVNITRQIEKLKEKPQIIVGSSGRILELIKKRKITAHTVKTIIIDEADRLLDKNNIESVQAVIKTTLKERQLIALSATISPNTIDIAKELMKDPQIIAGEEKNSVPESIDHIYLKTERRDKFETLKKLIRIINPKKAIVFINKSSEIDETTSKLIYHGIKAQSIHGTDIKMDRKKTMEEFRTGKIQILVASDLAARGIDIEDVTHIFNLDIPEDSQNYLHRVGRTGRKGLSGVAISIVTDKELPLITMFQNTLKIKITEKDMYEGKIIDIDKKSYKNSLKSNLSNSKISKKVNTSVQRNGVGKGKKRDK